MVHRRSTYAIHGGSLKSFMESVKNFLQKTKLVSRVGRVLAPLAGNYSGIANSAIDVLQKKGYGRRRVHHRRHFLGHGMVHQTRRRVHHRRRRVGMGALRLAGSRIHSRRPRTRRGMGALSLAGGRMRSTRRMRMVY